MGERDRGIHVGVTSTRAQVIVGLVLLMAFGWWDTAQPPFSVSGTIGVLVAGVALIGLARLWRHGMQTDDRSAGNEKLWVWAVVIGAIVVWELITFLGHPREAHPTISSMADTVQAEHAVRWLFFGGWVALGWSLAT
jgi:hypothetical protein